MPLANRRTRIDVNLTSRPVLLLPSRECLGAAGTTAVCVATPPSNPPPPPSFDPRKTPQWPVCACTFGFLGVRVPCLRKATRPLPASSWVDGTFALCFSASTAARPREKPAGRLAAGAVEAEGVFWLFVFSRAREFLFLALLLLSRPHDLFRGRSGAGVAALGKLPPTSLLALGENRRGTLSFHRRALLLRVAIFRRAFEK